jgi:hypothetical protein
MVKKRLVDFDHCLEPIEVYRTEHGFYPGDISTELTDFPADGCRASMYLMKASYRVAKDKKSYRFLYYFGELATVCARTSTTDWRCY